MRCLNRSFIYANSDPSLKENAESPFTQHQSMHTLFPGCNEWQGVTMYYRDDIIRYLQSNNILALKLDQAVTGVHKAVSNQIEIIGAGAKRARYYTSCLPMNTRMFVRDKRQKMSGLHKV